MKRKNTLTSLFLFSLFTGVLLMALPDCQASGKGAAKASPSPKNAGSSQLPVKDLPADVKSFLLRLARESLEASVKKQTPPKPQNPPEATKQWQGCFVTLTVAGELRGCIGYIEGIKPLYEAVIDNAKNAALSDPRFPAVTPDELSRIRIEVSVLTPPVPLEYKDPQDLLNKLVPNEDGIILQKGFYQSTFLPQVWEQLPDKVQFLEHLSMKGGMDSDGWKTATVKRYRAIHFQEHD
jgi:AmmeMemoRadiSam system protein A